MWSNSDYLVFVCVISGIFCLENGVNKPTGKDSNRIVKVGDYSAENGVINHDHEHILHKRTEEKKITRIKDGKLHKMIKSWSDQWRDILNLGNSINEQVNRHIKEATEGMGDRTNRIIINGDHGPGDLEISNNGPGIKIITGTQGGLSIGEISNGGIVFTNNGKGIMTINSNGIQINNNYQGGEPYNGYNLPNIHGNNIIIDDREPEGYTSNNNNTVDEEGNNLVSVQDLEKEWENLKSADGKTKHGNKKKKHTRPGGDTKSTKLEEQSRRRPDDMDGKLRENK